MRTVVLSDIHANLDALEAVLDHAGQFDALWILGDVVGYGPQPDACIERLRDLKPEHWLAGNHDWAALGTLDDGEFNPDARSAARWTRGHLSSASRQLLGTLDPRIDLPGGEFTLAHGSPRHPIWEYILDAGTAAENLNEFASRICLFGHTHVPVIYEEAVDGAVRLALPVGEAVKPGRARWLINPGSVGQPRDEDPRASYMVLDHEAGTYILYRVPYDVAAVQSKIIAARLPTALATRLQYGW
jgi:predicted phosphodiesterase